MSENEPRARVASFIPPASARISHRPERSSVHPIVEPTALVPPRAPLAREPAIGDDHHDPVPTQHLTARSAHDHALARPATRPPPPPHPNAALLACNACVASCEAAWTQSIWSDRTEASCCALMRDTADACMILARFVARESAHRALLARVCVELCEACAVACERLASTDELYRRCAIDCARCATECVRLTRG